MTGTLPRNLNDEFTDALAAWIRLAMGQRELTPDEIRMLDDTFGRSFTVGCAYTAQTVMGYVTEALKQRVEPADLLAGLVQALEPIASKTRGAQPLIH